jgi:sugar/nucleoside kinase (ribokinase family)
MAKICAFGELLCDVTPYGVSDRGFPIYEFNPGGAPANVAVALRNLGIEASFMGQVGNDHFGNFLRKILMDKQVDVDALLMSDRYPTSLAIVSNKEDGDRSFSFYRKHNADVMLKYHDLFKQKIKEADVFHVGSVSMSDEPCRSTTFKLMQDAKRLNKFITFDPNLRVLLWDDLNDARNQIEKGLQLADIVKLSEEELYFLTDIKEAREACSILMSIYDIQLLVITFGAEGCATYHQDVYQHIPSFKVDAIDTTGAGDGFFGGFLSQWIKNGMKMKLTRRELALYCQYANACGAIATTQKGAIGSLATEESVQFFLEKHNG